MLCYEGNFSTLDLAEMVQYFGYRDYGNDLYMMSVWKTFLFQPVEFFRIALMGGGLYALFLMTSALKTFGLWPASYFRNYPAFDFVLLIRVCLLYGLPFAVGWLFQKVAGENNSIVSKE